MTDEKLAFQEKMSDMSDWHIQRNMQRFQAVQDVKHVIKTPGQLAEAHSKQMKRVIIRKNGVIVSDKTGYAKPSAKRYKYGS